MTLAPASRQRAASSPSSSAVMGRCGVISRVVSAPQMAAVMIAGSVTWLSLTEKQEQLLLSGLSSSFGCGHHASPDGAADDDGRVEHVGGGVGNVGPRRDVLARFELHRAARLAHRDDLGFHLHEIARVQGREEL